MTGSRAETAYARAITAFSTPTLDLLHGRFAPFVVASLTLLFNADRASVAVADAHAEPVSYTHLTLPTTPYV